VSRASAQPTSAFDWGIDEHNVMQVPGYLSVLANDEDIDFGGNPTSGLAGCVRALSVVCGTLFEGSLLGDKVDWRKRRLPKKRAVAVKRGK
jgi:hypothetical protein